MVTSDPGLRKTHSFVVGTQYSVAGGTLRMVLCEGVPFGGLITDIPGGNWPLQSLWLYLDVMPVSRLTAFVRCCAPWDFSLIRGSYCNRLGLSVSGTCEPTSLILPFRSSAGPPP